MQAPREIRILLAEYGCTIEAVRANRHWVVKCRSSHGKPFVLTIANSSSDRRSVKNLRRDIERKCA
jgi:hypothetical protein